jgi:hypothetical protein
MRGVKLTTQRITPYIDEIIGNHLCSFEVTDELLIRYSAFVGYWRKNRNIMVQSTFIYGF